jgi:hypothetical protein
MLQQNALQQCTCTPALVSLAGIDMCFEHMIVSFDLNLDCSHLNRGLFSYVENWDVRVQPMIELKIYQTYGILVQISRASSC